MLEIKRGPVSVTFDISQEMVRDWAEHNKLARVPGGPGKDCDSCSLNIEIFGVGICVIPEVIAELNRLAGIRVDEA